MGVDRVSPDHAAAARAWLDRMGLLTPSTTSPADNVLVNSLERELAETAAAARREQREADAKLCEAHRIRILASKAAALGCGREVVASHRESDAETCERLAAAIRAGDAAAIKETK